jgi:hypothetical protein
LPKQNNDQAAHNKADGKTTQRNILAILKNGGCDTVHNLVYGSAASRRIGVVELRAPTPKSNGTDPTMRSIARGSPPHSPGASRPALAAAFRIKGERANNPDELQAALQRGIRVTREGHPYLIDVAIARTGLGIDATAPKFSLAKIRTRMV